MPRTTLLSEQDLALVRDLVARARLAAQGVDLGRVNNANGFDIGGRHLGPRANNPDPITLKPREREVARLMVEGLTNPEIGALLRVPTHTASRYVQAVVRKLGARNRTHAATLFVRSIEGGEFLIG